PGRQYSSQLLSSGSVETVGVPWGGPGFLLTDVSLRPVYTNSSALRILNYPNEPATTNPHDVQEHLRRILHTDWLTTGSRSTTFLSGRRRYVCRPFVLESADSRSRQSIIVILLERQPRDPVDLSEVSRRFHLSPRERETVQYLICGLTTKEVG